MLILNWLGRLKLKFFEYAYSYQLALGVVWLSLESSFIVILVDILPWLALLVSLVESSNFKHIMRCEIHYILYFLIIDTPAVPLTICGSSSSLHLMSIYWSMIILIEKLNELMVPFSLSGIAQVIKEKWGLG